MLKKILLFLLITLAIARPILTVIDNKELIFNRGYANQYENLKNFYYSSQYIVKQNPAIMGDQHLESFAGGAFLYGLNPILIVHDQPPLGRYITSLSIYLFDNSRTINMILNFFSLLGIFMIGVVIFKNNIYALIPVAIFSNEELFLSKFTFIPLLESIQLPFIIFSIFFFMKAFTDKRYLRWLVLTSVMLGCVISIRFFVLGAALLISMLVGILISKEHKKLLVPFLISLPLSLLILILSYSKTISLGYSILQILGIQKYILAYHQSKFILPFSFWDLLLFNRWHTWWGDWTIASDYQWTMLWPISVVLIVAGLIIMIGKRLTFSIHEKIILLWVITLCLMLSGGYTSTRYFLPLIPFLYILALSFTIKTIKTFK